MTDSREQAYLQQVLQLDPGTEAATLLKWRHSFLNPSDVFVADMIDDDFGADDLRTRLMQRLNALRQQFWELDAQELKKHLVTFQSIAHAETKIATTRLQRVASHRQAILHLRANPNLSPVFVKSFSEILIGPAKEANRLRERELRLMRPGQNLQYETVQRAVQGSAHLIRSNYPDLFKLEEPWLTELLEYSPVEETEAESSAAIKGKVITIACGIVIWFIVVCILKWVF